MEKASLLEQWKSRKKSETASMSIKKAPEGVPIPLSHSQQRLWFLQQLYPENPVYNYSELLRFTGNLHVDLLLLAVHAVFRNHDILRTVYGSEDGKPFMGIAPEPAISITRHDLRSSANYGKPHSSGTGNDSQSSGKKVDFAVRRILQADATHSFDLSEPPVALVSVLQTEDEEYQILLTLHHIAMDKGSMRLLLTEWASYYKTLLQGSTPGPKQTALQYRDFAYWQRNREIKGEQVAYWKKKLSGDIPIIDLPTDFPRPRESNFAGRSSEFRHFSKEVSQNILGYCKQLGVTPYVFFLSIYYLFLYRYTRQNDILIGSPISNRDQEALEDTIGFFNDTIVLRTEIDPESTFPDLVRAVKTTTLEAFSNKEVPFEFLVRELHQERSLSLHPFFQVMFLYYSLSEPESFGTDLKVDHEFYNPGVSKFDLTFDVAEKNGRLSFAFEYSTDLFTAKTIARFKGHIALLVKGVLAFPQKSLSDIPMLTAEEMDFLLPEKNRATDTFDAFMGIHQCIERMAGTRPDAPAVSFREATITYGALDAKARAVAARILETTEGRNEIVGLCVERSLEMIVGLLAILKAGCAYLPIDPTYPIRHVDYMMADADIKLLVTQRKLRPLFEKSKVKPLFLEDIEEFENCDDFEDAPMSFGGAPQAFGEDVKPLKDAPIDPEEVAQASEKSVEHFETLQKNKMPTPKKSDLAYIIYTSGSTGRPKGVPITHGNILNATAGRLDFYPENPKVFLLLSSISFDSSKAGIFWTLCTGGTLVVTEDRIEQDLVKVGDSVQRNGVTHMLLLPTLYQLILEHVDPPKLNSLATVMVAGEACHAALADIHFGKLPDTALYNEYGPTEATVWCTAHKVEKNGRGDSVPLGRPVANARIYLLDAAKNLVPLGATGEIYIGGPGLSSGYLNRPELTEITYCEDPFSDTLGEKLYRTRDLARYNPDGELTFLGRSDQQVKIRGYRVELEAIEKAIRAAVKVDQVAVLAEGEGNGPKRIAAYLTASRSLDIPSLKESLENSLPRYMLPAFITQVETLPVLPNGKIDKVALKQRDRTVKSGDTAKKQAPKNKLEQKLYDLWRDILKQDDIGVHDNFFALGGDSILSIQFIAKARKTGIQITPNQIFDHQTIAALAGYIEAKEKEGEEWDYLVALRKAGSEKPLFCIHAGGGHVFFYNILTKYIGAHRPIYALQASGVYADREMHHSIEAMAKDYLQAIRSVQPTGPYNIMVYCFSVAVGQEMLIQLTAADETANLIVMDTMTDPWKLDTAERLRMRMKSFGKRFLAHPVTTIRAMVGGRMIQLRLKLRKILAKGDDKTLARMNDNLAHICSQYAWRPHRQKVTLLLTDKPDGDINREVIGSWKKVALGGVEVVPVTGNHIDLFAEPEVKAVAEKIDAVCV